MSFFDDLSGHPLIISQFPIKPDGTGLPFCFGELRLLFDPSSISDGTATCEVLSALFSASQLWNCRPQDIAFAVSGAVEAIEQSETTVAISGDFEMTLEAHRQEGTLPPKRHAKLVSPRSRKQGARVSLSLTRPNAQSALFSLTGIVRLRDSQGTAMESEGITTQTLNLKGEARLYKEPLPSIALGGEYEGEYYLALVPVPVATSSPTIPQSLKAQAIHAASTWKAGAVSVEISARVHDLEVDASVIADLDGMKVSSLEKLVLERLSGQFVGVPLVLVDPLFHQGGGVTARGTVLTGFTILTNRSAGNPHLLAHEVGHLLGGDEEGDTAVGDRWAECPDTNSVMKPTGSTEIPNSTTLGCVAKKQASRWAFFREKRIPQQ